jgi:hypothetical protein
VGLGLEVDPVDLGPLAHPGGRVAAVVARVVDGHDGGRLAELLRRPVEPVHGLGAVAVAALQDDVLELPTRPPGGGGGDHVGLLVEGQAGQGRRGPEGLAEGEDLGLDLAVLGHVLLGVVLVVAGVGLDVHLVAAADAALVVDPLPERLLSLGDGHGQGPERPFGQVRQHPQVDAVPLGVAAGAGLGGHTDVGLDVAVPPPPVSPPWQAVRTRASTASPTRILRLPAMVPPLARAVAGKVHLIPTAPHCGSGLTCDLNPECSRFGCVRP